MKEKISSSQKALNLWAVILILWSFYRANFRQDLPVWFDELIMKPLFFILPVYWYIKKIEKKPFFKSVHFHFKKVLSDSVLGVALGVIFFAAGLLSLYVKSGSFMLTNILNLNLLFSFVIAVGTSISEELLSRGFILKRLWEDSSRPVWAVAISSLLFFFLHIPILLTSVHINGVMLLQIMATDLVLSVAVSVLFIQRKSLLIAIIIHAFYALSLSTFL